MASQLHCSAFWSQPALAPRLAVLVLNAPLGGPWAQSGAVTSSTARSKPRELFWSLWSRAELTVCADGGANRLFERCSPVEAQQLAVPRFIKGDLDSLRPDVRQFYEQRGATVIRDPSQDTNDLDKCLQLIHEQQQQSRKDQERFSVVIFGAMGGRFDQEMQNVNALFRWSDMFEQIVLLSEDTTARLLAPGVDHVIRPNLTFETRTCGLIPVAGACEATTTSGLKWNLDGDKMKFGGLISSSNHIVGGEDQEDEELAKPEVRVRCSHPLIWTTELRR